MSCLRDRWVKDLTPEEIQSERNCVKVLDESCENPVMNMLKCISEIYEGEKRTYFGKEGDETVSSYRILFLAHNASGFDSWVLLNSLEKQILDSKY